LANLAPSGAAEPDSCGITLGGSLRPAGLAPAARGGGVDAGARRPGQGQGPPQAVPQGRNAPLTRPGSGVGSAGWPRQRPVRGRVQGPGRGAGTAGEAVPGPPAEVPPASPAACAPVALPVSWQTDPTARRRDRTAAASSCPRYHSPTSRHQATLRQFLPSGGMVRCGQAGASTHVMLHQTRDKEQRPTALSTTWPQRAR
jgi:hypothetical protein